MKAPRTPDAGKTCSPPSQARGIRRARELQEVATELFIEKGIEETTIDEIVERAGVAKGTFYHYYPSKAALVNAIGRSVTEDFDSYIEAAMREQTSVSPARRLDTWIQAVCEAYAMIIQRQDIGFSSAGFRWTPRGQTHLELLVALLEEGNRQAAWSLASLYETAIFIEKGVLGVMDDLVLAGQSLDGVHKNIRELVHRAVGI